MKKIKYQLLCKQTNTAYDDNGVPSFVEINVLTNIETDYTESEYERIKQIAHNGECTIVDDGVEEQPTDAERIAELEEALALLLSGVTE